MKLISLWFRSLLQGIACVGAWRLLHPLGVRLADNSSLNYWLSVKLGEFGELFATHLDWSFPVLGVSFVALSLRLLERDFYRHKLAVEKAMREQKKNQQQHQQRPMQENSNNHDNQIDLTQLLGGGQR